MVGPTLGLGGGESISIALGLGAWAAAVGFSGLPLTPAPPSPAAVSPVTVARRGVLFDDVPAVADLFRGDGGLPMGETGDRCVALGTKFCGPNDSVHSLGSNLKAGDSGAGALAFDELSEVSGRRLLVGDAVFLRPRWPLDLDFLTGGASVEVSEPAVKVNPPGGASFVNQGPGDSVGFLSKAGCSPCGFALSLRLSLEDLGHSVRYPYLYSPCLPA